MRRARINLHRMWRHSHWFQISTVLAAAAAAGCAVERDRHATATKNRLSSQNLGSYSDMFLSSYVNIISPRHVACESFLGKWFKGRSTLADMDSLRDKRWLKTVYSVDWKSPLGEGGFGAVYPATNKKTNEKVALKKISKEFTDDEGFRQEMEALLKIRKAGGHPNLCGLHENFDEGGYFYLALDLISGGEMFDHLINSGPYSEADAARLIRGVASALSFLHGIDIVHCDLKPENLMLSTDSTTDSTVKIIDFGTSQVLDDNDVAAVSASEVGTTPAYCPPEVLMSGAAKKSPSMDMWAVGVILYVMLVGLHPFDLRGDAPDEVICDRVVNRESPPLRNSRYTRHLSDSAIDLIERLLCWDEESRLTADEMLQHPWVQGVTAKKSKIWGSDSKLSKLKPFRSRLEARVFQDFLSRSDDGGKDTGASKMSLIEHSFRKLDRNSKGFVTVQDAGNGLDEVVDTEGEELSLTTFSALLSEHMQNLFLKKGDILFKEGDEGKDMYFINSGVVEVVTEGGYRTTLKAGDYVGEGALLSHKKRSGTVRCTTPVHAIKITKEYFEKYLSASGSELNLRMLETSKSRDISRELFDGFSSLLSQNMKNKSFKSGDVIYKEGDKGRDMFFIKSGTVSVTNKDGFRATLKQGDFVGEGALIKHKPRSGTVTCLTPVEAMFISRSYFEKYMASSDANLRSKMYKESKRRDLSRIRTILGQQKYLRTLKISKGDLLFKEGDSTKNLYIVIDGEVDLETGNKTALKAREGDVVGEHSLIFESPRNSSARCATNECDVVEIGPRAFRGFLESSASLKDSLADLCYQREFQKAVVLYTKKDFPETEAELRDAFAKISGGGKRSIVLKDVQRLIKNMNPRTSQEAIKTIFLAVDLGGKGSIDFETFKVLFFNTRR
eukprot:scaffold3103_cov136-Cylindrotheca_fusiformis.AAC.17